VLKKREEKGLLKSPQKKVDEKGEMFPQLTNPMVLAK